MLNHKKLLASLAKEFAPVLKHSPDAVYLWLDEQNVVGNAKFAKLFGRPAKGVKGKSFLDLFVAERDHEKFADHYHKTIAGLGSPVRFKFHGRRTSGRTMLLETDMIPITWKGHVVAYHFVRKA